METWNGGAQRTSDFTHQLRRGLTPLIITTQARNALARLTAKVEGVADNASRDDVAKRITNASARPFRRTRNEHEQQLPIPAEIVWIRPHTLPKRSDARYTEGDAQVQLIRVLLANIIRLKFKQITTKRKIGI